MATDRFITEINRLPVWYGDKLKTVRDLFSRKEQKITSKDNKFFTQYWQVFSWAAIIGFINNQRCEGCELNNRTSFDFRTVSSNGEDVAQALILMAISKLNIKSISDITDARKILTIIGEYAEGGADYVLELRKLEGNENRFDDPDHFLMEIYERTKVSK